MGFKGIAGRFKVRGGGCSTRGRRETERECGGRR